MLQNSFSLHLYIYTDIAVLVFCGYDKRPELINSKGRMVYLAYSFGVLVHGQLSLLFWACGREVHSESVVVEEAVDLRKAGKQRERQEGARTCPR
jgi:hypothetical protein